MPVAIPVSRTESGCEQLSQSMNPEDVTYHALLAGMNYPVPDPETPGPHQICHHDVCAEPVTDDGYLRWMRYTGFGVLFEVFHDLRATARFLGGMRQHGKAGGLFQLCCQAELAIE